MPDSANPYRAPKVPEEQAISARAVCPNCQTVIPRFDVAAGIRRTCKSCGLRYKPKVPHSVLAPILANLVIVPACFAAAAGILSWPRVGGVVALVFVAGWFVFPYLTPYELVAAVEGGDDGAVSSPVETRG